MIMTTHQALAPIDDKMPATQSEKIYTYIQKNFPNALIIADSISIMRAVTSIKSLSKDRQTCL